MQTIVYLVLGLAIMGGLFWALMQITARQQRLNAELTRLERLAAEVTMSAEAILDRVDERAMQLNELLERAEAQIAAASAAAAAPAPAPAPGPTPAAMATGAAAPPAPAPAPAQASEPEAPQPPANKYQDLRTAAWQLADQGADPTAIAAALGIPRGEVLLLLNLRAKKVTA